MGFRVLGCFGVVLRCACLVVNCCSCVSLRSCLILVVVCWRLLLRFLWWSFAAVFVVDYCGICLVVIILTLICGFRVAGLLGFAVLGCSFLG